MIVALLPCSKFLGSINLQKYLSFDSCSTELKPLFLLNPMYSQVHRRQGSHIQPGPLPTWCCSWCSWCSKTATHTLIPAIWMYTLNILYTLHTVNVQELASVRAYLHIAQCFVRALLHMSNQTTLRHNPLLQTTNICYWILASKNTNVASIYTNNHLQNIHELCIYCGIKSCLIEL